MGFTFAGTSFTIGIVEVTVNSVDTEKFTGWLGLRFPLGKGKLEIKVNSSVTWDGQRQLGTGLSWLADRPPEPDEPEWTEDEQEELDSA